MKVKIKTLSPLHIGGKESAISSLNYVVLNGRCYVINEEKLSEKLYEKKRLNEFVDFAVRKGKRADIKEFLASYNLLNSSFVSSIASYFTTCRRAVYGDVRPFVRDAFARPYLPGSSIKGSLRTSIIYIILKRMREDTRRKILVNFVQKKIERYRKDPRGRKNYVWFKERFKKWFAEELDRNIFKGFTLKGKRGRDAHYDILRYLKVSDSAPLLKDNLIVEEVKIFSSGSRENFKRWSIFAECVPPGVEFEFEVNIDKGILEDFMKDNPHLSYDFDARELYDILLHPLEAAREKIFDLLEEERDFFRQSALFRDVLRFNGEKPNFRLGWGQGLLGASVDILLPRKVRQDLRNTFFKNCGAAPAPKSRKVVIDNKKTFGWCRVEVMH